MKTDTLPTEDRSTLNTSENKLIKHNQSSKTKIVKIYEFVNKNNNWHYCYCLVNNYICLNILFDFGSLFLSESFSHVDLFHWFWFRLFTAKLSDRIFRKKTTITPNTKTTIRKIIFQFVTFFIFICCYFSLHHFYAISLLLIPCSFFFSDSRPKFLAKKFMTGIFDSISLCEYIGFFRFLSFSHLLHTDPSHLDFRSSRIYWWFLIFSSLFSNFNFILIPHLCHSIHFSIDLPNFTSQKKAHPS